MKKAFTFVATLKPATVTKISIAACCIYPVVAIVGTLLEQLNHQKVELVSTLLALLLYSSPYALLAVLCLIPVGRNWSLVLCVSSVLLAASGVLAMLDLLPIRGFYGLGLISLLLLQWFGCMIAFYVALLAQLLPRSKKGNTEFRADARTKIALLVAALSNIVFGLFRVSIGFRDLSTVDRYVGAGPGAAEVRASPGFSDVFTIPMIAMIVLSILLCILEFALWAKTNSLSPPKFASRARSLGLCEILVGPFSIPNLICGILILISVKKVASRADDHHPTTL